MFRAAADMASEGWLAGADVAGLGTAEVNHRAMGDGSERRGERHRLASPEGRECEGRRPLRRGVRDGWMVRDFGEVRT